MAKKSDQYPECGNIIARVEAMMRALAAADTVLRSVQDAALPSLPEPLRKVLERQVAEALVVVDEAFQASQGK